MEINHVTIPESMWGKTHYRWSEPEALGFNGQKQPIKATSAASLELFYDFLEPDEWDWWATTLLSGEDSAEFDHAILFDDNGDSITFNHCIVYRPVRGSWEFGKHRETVVRIVDIL
jgi:hypothetical protein